jgi:hypothetical protein
VLISKEWHECKSALVGLKHLLMRLVLIQSFGYLNISLIYQKRLKEQIYTRVKDILPRAPEAGRVQSCLVMQAIVFPYMGTALLQLLSNDSKSRMQVLK